MSPIDDFAGLNARVSVLEDWREEHREWMRELSAGVKRVNENLMALRLCNSPNLCSTLQKEIEELAKESKNAMRRIESLERWRTFMSGAATTIGVLWLILQVIIPWILKLSEVPAQ